MNSKFSIISIIISANILFSNNKALLNNDYENIQLIFIYNAKSGFIHSVMDYVHKFVSPETYSCNLCKLTYYNSGKKDKWAAYLNTLPFEVKFFYKDNIHKDQFDFQYRGVTLPSVFLIVQDETINLITSDEINKIKEVEDLIKILNHKLVSY